MTEQEYLLANAESDLKQALALINTARIRALNAKSLSIKHSTTLTNCDGKIRAVLRTLSDKIKIEKTVVPETQKP